MKLGFADVETTGLDSKRHEIFEFALVTDDDVHVIWLPVDESKADQGAFNVNKYYHRKKEGYSRWGMPFLEGAEKIASLTTNLLIGGINIQYDDRMLRAMFRRAGLVPAWEYKLFEVTDYAAGSLGLDPSIGCSSTVVSKALGIKQNESTRHTALGDALFAREIYVAAQAKRKEAKTA